MGWKGEHSSMIIQGSNTNDFVTTGAYLEIELPVIELTPGRAFEGDSREYNDSFRSAVTAQRRVLTWKTLGFDKFPDPAPSDKAAPDWADFELLCDIFACRYRRISTTYLLAADHDAGPIPRAYTNANPTSSMWKQQVDSPPGILPFYFNPKDDMTPSRDESGSGSFYRLTMQLEEVRLL